MATLVKRLACGWVLVIVAAGCGGGNGGGGDGDDFAYPIAGYEVDWAPCSLHEGADDGRAECATVALPLLWDVAEDTRTLGIRVKRLLAAEPSDVQVWLLAGGPGQSGTWSLPGHMESLQARYPAADLYTLDHRGTGGSGRLGCPEAEDESSHAGANISSVETPACVEQLLAEWGDGLGGVTTTAAAIDAAALIEATREAGKRVIVQGGSYGTYWAQRYLQIFPDQADGAVLAGIFPADGTAIWYDEKTNEVAHAFLDLCGQDPFCSAKLGDDPWSRLGAVLEDMSGGHCTQNGLSGDLVRVLFAYLLYWDTTNIVVPAAIHRLERCAPEDSQAIYNLYLYLFGDGGAWDLESYSILLQHHIKFSEMWDHPDFVEVDLVEYFNGLDAAGYVMKNSGPTQLNLKSGWPTYDDTRWDNGWADTATPMLMLQGRYDPATPLSEAARAGEHFAGEHQHFVEFPTAAHRTLGGTTTTGGDDCAYELLVAFYEDPEARLDTACLDELAPIDFTGSAALAQDVFGLPDLWDNP